MAYLEELLPEFRKGAKIRLGTWDKEKYIFYTGSDVHDNNDKTVKIDGYQLATYEWELYQEPKKYNWQKIVDKQYLCWFWDDEKMKFLGHLCRFPQDGEYFRTDGYRYFKHCRPVRRDEVIFYEDKKDD